MPRKRKEQQPNNTALQPVAPEDKPIKKRGRGGKYNFPCAIDPDTEDKDTIRAVLTDTLHWFDRGEDRPTTDEDIYKRCKEYFDSCMKTGVRPTVEALCLALGYSRQTVNEWKNGLHASPARSDIIKKAFNTFATFDASMASNGKLNPVLYFFRAKNYYDMRDSQELVLTPNSPLQSDIDQEEVARKYKELPKE